MPVTLNAGYRMPSWYVFTDYSCFVKDILPQNLHLEQGDNTPSYPSAYGNLQVRVLPSVYFD